MSVPNNSRSTLFSFVTTAGLSPLQLQLENKCHLTKYALKLQMNVQRTQLQVLELVLLRACLKVQREKVKRQTKPTSVISAESIGN